ncbi:MAG: alpha/beta hydrolase [Candidatus Omnitrophica bacterium]|nr:alpha/beta hydrolase [Candidatus Omnitrophota bacterium]
MFKIIIYAVLFCIFIVVYARYIELRSIFFPMKQIEITPKEEGLNYEDVYFKTEDGLSLNGWLVKQSQAKATILFFHGNAGNISHRLEKLVIFHQLGLNVFLVDYRGYGRSQGRPSEDGLYKDARAAFDYLSSRPDINNKTIIAYGESIGGAVAIDLAAKRGVCCLIIDSTFTSAKDMARKFYPFIPPFLFKTKFDSAQKVKDITSDKLFIHSINDEIVPFEFGQKLYEEAIAPKELLKIHGGHNSGFLESKELIIFKLKDFLQKLNLI